MSEYFDEEAEVSDGNESSDNEVIAEKNIKTKKPKRNMVSDDEDEEEEDDEEMLKEEMKDLINDEEEDVEDEDDEDVDGGDEKRKRDSDDEDDQLEDDDYALLEENLGIKVKRQPKRKRIRVISDDEDSEKDEEEGRENRDAIANELFEGNDEEEELPDIVPKRQEMDLDVEESDEESDVDDFIVDERGHPLSKKAKKKKNVIHSDSALQEAQDIFGVDFDFDEFNDYGDSEDELEDNEYVDEEADADQRRTKKSRKRSTKKTIYDVYEPSDLERFQLTELDNEIRNIDIPERFKLRSIPVEPSEDDDELADEAIWIYKQAFQTSTISQQNMLDHVEDLDSQLRNRKAPTTVTKIKKSLNCMRNQQFEVPFIAFYRKEDIEPELTINDLWKVYFWDEKWVQLKRRKRVLRKLFEKMQTYQYNQYSDPDQLLSSSVRPLTEEDVNSIEKVETMEELGDIYSHFILYYGSELPHMQNDEARKKTANDDDVEKVKDSNDVLKQPTRKNDYRICAENRLGEIAEKFGLTADHLGENIRDNYQRHKMEQCPLLPNELAEDYICSQFPTVEDVLKAVRHMVAVQISHDPLVRRCIRETFRERAKVKVTPTKKGIKEIDENHPCYTMKYLKNKPVCDFCDDQFLKLFIAENDGYLNVSLSMDGEDMSVSTYFEDIKQLYQRDEFSDLVQQWNDVRSDALERALNAILYPQFCKELTMKLVQESQQGITKACCRKLHSYLKVAPYRYDQENVDADDDCESSVRVLGIAFSTLGDTPCFGAMIDSQGEVIDHIRFVNLLKRRNSWKAQDREDKENDLTRLKDFIALRKPHVIAVMAESREAMMLQDDIQKCLSELIQAERVNPANVELVDSELSIIYSRTEAAKRDFKEFPEVLRQAISIARRLQDPLIEFSQLCNVDEDMICLKYHPLQDYVPKDELKNALFLEFINRVNEVGVDINAAISHPHTTPLVQFICGLGPRKASYLIKVLKQNSGRLENRSQLVTTCHLGPKVFLNCAGFIKIDTSSIGDSTEAYIEVLDGSRVHPETYEWARKMAVDALEYDDTAEDANPAGALEEILESPERLKDLDLEAFAEELERQGYGNKHITLYDIRAELNYRYKDLRTQYTSPTHDEIFHMVTRETPDTLYIGRLVLSQVTGIAHRRPHNDEMDRAQPVRSKDSGLWQCPFCRTDLPEISDVWSHLDSGTCPGSSVGVRTRLDNGISGFVPTRMISDTTVVDPEERVKIGMMVYGRVTKIDVERFQVELSTRSTDLIDNDNMWKPQRDTFYDFEQDDKDVHQEQEAKRQKARQTYIKRVIAHPSFHNIGYKECEAKLDSLDSGDVIIRPSSKGADHLTLTWKISNGVHQHVDIREEGKENAFSLGRSLWIGEEEFEDLDEIIARYIQPMASFVRDIINFRVFRDDDRETLEQLLATDKKATPSRIPYYLSVSKDYPGKFLLSYLPRHKPRHEFISITPDGVRFRQQVFHSLTSLIRWFKEHYRDPIPGTPAQNAKTPVAAVPTPAAPSITPAMRGSTPRFPGSMYRHPAGTPQQFPAGYQSGYPQYGYNAITPAMRTPSMRTPSFRHQGPFATPVATPLYQQPTPRWPNATPHTPAPRTPAPRTPAPRTPASWTPQQIQRPSVRGSATDWAKAAELWAKQL